MSRMVLAQARAHHMYQFVLLSFTIVEMVGKLLVSFLKRWDISEPLAGRQQTPAFC